MNHKIICRTPELIARAGAIVAALPVDPVHEVVIKEKGKSRTRDQDGLYFTWCGIIGAELGYSKDEAHEEMKRLFLVPILVRDDAEYAEMWRDVEQVWDDCRKDRLRRWVARETSITRLKVKQMAELMTEVNRFAIGMAIYLPHPEDVGR